MEPTNELKNIEFKKDCAIIKINPKIFQLDIIYSAAYIMIDKAFIVLDGDPEKEVLVEVRTKEAGQDLKRTVQEFYEELLNYAVYKSQSERNAGIREIILQRALLTNDPIYLEMKRKKNQTADPKGIAKKWEENEANKTQ
jgi:His-Xaa-Ser system protein HxsD